MRSSGHSGHFRAFRLVFGCAGDLGHFDGLLVCERAMVRGGASRHSPSSQPPSPLVTRSVDIQVYMRWVRAGGRPRGVASRGWEASGGQIPEGRSRGRAGAAPHPELV